MKNTCKLLSSCIKSEFEGNIFKDIFASEAKQFRVNQVCILCCGCSWT